MYSRAIVNLPRPEPRAESTQSEGAVQVMMAISASAMKSGISAKAA